MVEGEENKLKLMVVDDESDNLDLLYRTFRRDFQVFRANSGSHALQTLAEVGEMAVIISDQRMPHMNGTEFLSRTVERFPDTLRILLTGYTDMQDLVGAINAGKVFKYITKPWQPEELKTVVQQAAETYRVVKQRTNELNRALQRESIFNAVTTAIRESLDYHSMLQRVVDTIGSTFAADTCTLYPVECSDKSRIAACHISSEAFIYRAGAIDPPPSQPGSQVNGHSSESGIGVSCPLPLPPAFSLSLLVQEPQLQLIPPTADNSYTHLIVPLTYQQVPLAILMLQRQAEPSWSKAEILLIQEVATQAALAISQAKLHQQIQQQTEQMQAELVVARQIQMNLLRQSWATPEGVRVQAQCRPAREIGGDFFEVYIHPQGDIWLAVGDVSGKGVPAALFMASAISLLRRELSQEVPPPPHRVLKNLNHSLLDDLVSSNCFITMVLAQYNPVNRELTYANAGHIYPMVWSQTRVLATAGQASPETPTEPHYLHVRGVPLGILPHWKAGSGSLSMNAGDVLLLTSDGITEATLTSSSRHNVPKSVMLQQSGLWQILAQQQGRLNLVELLALIQSQTLDQEDDQTILSLEVL